MFSGLNEAEKQIVVDAMEEKKAFKNEAVIKEGDDGDVLFVVAVVHHRLVLVIVLPEKMVQRH